MKSLDFIISFNRSLWERRGLITINPSPSIQVSTPSLFKHALWSLITYVFGVIVVFKIVEKTQLLTMPTPKLSVDSILRFVLVLIQYLGNLFRKIGKPLVKCIGKIIEKDVG